MQTPKLKLYRPWFSSGLSLEDIGNQLIVAGLVVEFYYDAENVYEWIIAKTLDNKIDLNISRKHNDGSNVSNEPITIIVEYAETEPSDSYVERIAGIVARALQTEVSLGTVEYLGGDNFRYNVQNKIIA